MKNLGKSDIKIGRRFIIRIDKILRIEKNMRIL